MSPRLNPRVTLLLLRLRSGTATVCFMLLMTIGVHAGLRPAITVPGDLRVVGANTALRPVDTDSPWRSQAPMPTARTGYAIGSLNGLIYTIGGSTLDGCTTVPVVEAYDPVNDFWIQNLTPLPDPPRWRPSGAVLDNLIYVLGGQETVSGCAGDVLDLVQAYDPAQNKWLTKSPILNPRIQIGAGVDPVHDLLYAVGGADTDFTALKTVEVYDPVTDSWTQKPDLNIARAFPAVAAFNGKVFAIGGQEGVPGTAVDTIEQFDPKANHGLGQWTVKASRVPHPRIHSAFAILDGKVYIIGGEATGHGFIATVDVYDPSSDSWTTIEPMPTARRRLGAAVVGNTIYAIGGESKVATAGQQFTYQITASNNPTYFDAQPLPQGLTIDHERGIISGTPLAPKDILTMTFTASNAFGSDSEIAGFLIGEPPPPIDDLPAIVSGTCVTGRAGQQFGFQVLSNNSSSIQSLGATGLPYTEGEGPDLIINPGTGLISGSVLPTDDGSAQSFGVALNLVGADVTQSYLELTFVSDPLFPVITSSSTANLLLNQFFSYTITADAPVTSFSYFGLDGNLNGTLPPGLTFDPETATISGIYTGNALLGQSRKGSSIERHGQTPGNPDGVETIKKEPPPGIQLCGQQNGVGTGTLPLTFIIGLHDYEVEALPTSTSEATDYAIFTDDPLISGIGAALLKSTAIGDYVSYTVSVPQSGTYDVKVGVKTSQSQGIVQLSIDGVDQGSPQDEYSETENYAVRDLGPVTFSSSGTKTFRFSITGQNPSSNGYQFVCDYIDLTPFYEAENLQVRNKTGSISIVHDSDLSGGAGMLLRGSQPGDFLTYSMPIAKAGVYDVQVRTKPGQDSDAFGLLIDGNTQGYTQGVSSVSEGPDGVHDLGTVSFDTPGSKAFKFVLTDDNSNLSNLRVLLDYIELVLTNHFEAENLSSDSTGRLQHTKDFKLSGKEGIVFTGKAPGDYVTYEVTVPLPGSYNVKLGVRKSMAGGIVQFSANGANFGNPQDMYAAATDYAVIDLGRITLGEAGDTVFQFEITGQNSNSSGYEFVLDYIDLVR